MGRPRVIIPVGKKFGKRTVISGPCHHPELADSRLYVRCRCECGKIVLVRTDHLRPGGCASYCKSGVCRYRLGSLASRGQKRCSRCKTFKKTSLFFAKPGKSDGLYSWCKDCCKDKELRKNYGIGLPDYQKMCKFQNGKCKICAKRPKSSLCVDHCHKTKVVRGLLCGRCNTFLGAFQDNPVLIRNAAQYLDESNIELRRRAG